MAEEKNTPPQLPRIRTYANDIARTIKERGETLATIATAERAKKTTTPPPTPPFSRARLVGLFSIMFVFIAGGSALIGISIFLTGEETPEREARALIFTNDTLTVPKEVRDRAISEFASLRETALLSLGEVAKIQLENDALPPSIQDTLEAMGAPDALTREVKEGVVGIHAFDRNQPFLLLSIDSYERSFRAMIDWERMMARDLGAFFKPNQAPGDVPPLATFEDAIIQNIDARIVSPNLQWPILYAFPTREMLIITTNEFTLREIMARLNSFRE